MHGLCGSAALLLVYSQGSRHFRTGRGLARPQRAAIGRNGLAYATAGSGRVTSIDFDLPMSGEDIGGAGGLVMFYAGSRPLCSTWNYVHVFPSPAAWRSAEVRMVSSFPASSRLLSQGDRGGFNSAFRRLARLEAPDTKLQRYRAPDAVPPDPLNDADRPPASRDHLPGARAAPRRRVRIVSK